MNWTVEIEVYVEAENRNEAEEKAIEKIRVGEFDIESIEPF